MEIQRITKAGIIATILELDDPALEPEILSRSRITKLEWVQWLQSRIMLEEFRLYAVVTDNRIKGYMPIMHCFDPPVANFLTPVYQQFFGLRNADGKRYRDIAFDEVLTWARDLKTPMIMASARSKDQADKYMNDYGFILLSDIPLMLEIN
jgi:hypothetical protein